MAGYTQPRKINFVSVTFFLLLLAAGYGAWKFGPPYLRQYDVKSILETTANQCRRRISPSAERLEGLQRAAEGQIRALGVEGAVRVVIEVGSYKVRAHAQYSEVVHHLFVKKTTTLEFDSEIVRSRNSGR